MQAAAGPPRVLLVDDEVTLLNHLRRSALARGIAVDTAVDGQGAWRLLRERHYDLVVTDLYMPNMDGPELLGRIHEQQANTRVMVITGHASLDAAVDCLRKGAVDFLAKPFTVETFLESVGRALAWVAPPPVGAEPDWAEVRRQWRLSPRQVELLTDFYRTGRRNGQLAEAHALSLDTVKSHLKAVFQRAGVRTRSELIHKLREFIR